MYITLYFTAFLFTDLLYLYRLYNTKIYIEKETNSSSTALTSGLRCRTNEHFEIC